MFEITYTKDMAQSEAEDKINSGEYKAVLIIPADYSDSLAKNEKPQVILLTTSRIPHQVVLLLRP